MREFLHEVSCGLIVVDQMILVLPFHANIKNMISSHAWWPINGQKDGVSGATPLTTIFLSPIPFPFNVPV